MGSDPSSCRWIEGDALWRVIIVEFDGDADWVDWVLARSIVAVCCCTVWGVACDAFLGSCARCESRGLVDAPSVEVARCFINVPVVRGAETLLLFWGVAPL